MKRKLTAVISTLVISSLTFVTVFAFPGVPFDGQASATGIEVSLNLAVATVGIDIPLETTDIAGASDTPVQTNGAANGLTVALETGILPGVDVDMVDAATTKSYDGDFAIITDTNSLSSIDGATSPLATTGVITSASDSQVTNLVGWSFSRGNVTDTVIYGGVGGDPMISAGNIYNSTRSETTPANALVTNGSSVLSNVVVQVPYLVGTVDVLSADVITSTTEAISDGTLPNAAANSYVEFRNLVIGGTQIVTPTSAQVFTITGGIIPADVARVTVMPIMDSFTSTTSSSAEAVALSVEVLEGTLDGTEMLLGQSSAQSNASSSSSTGPTSITLRSSGSVGSNDEAMLPTVIFLIAALTVMTAVILYQQRIKLAD